MLLPRGHEYNEAVQNPRIAFIDSDLKSGSVEKTPLGLPKPYSGGFTITYKISNNNSAWAVRCFHREIEDLQKRYESIGNFLSKNPSQYFIDAKYLADGIKINEKQFPIIKMSWLDGEPLNNYLSKIYKERSKVDKIILDFVNIATELEKFGISHGDLQHGNIIVKSEKLYLIDYDGMFLPEIATLKTNEIGHINYQHPKRSAKHYDKFIDRFSAIVIYLGLKAISLKPTLWSKYDNGENILFKSQDYADLQQSPLILELSGIPEIKPLVDRLIGCCYLEFEKIPSLKEFLLGTFSYDKRAIGTINISKNQYEIIDGSRSGSILEYFGQKIEVVGRISAIKESYTKNGDPYILLNFTHSYPNNTFTITIWEDGIEEFKLKSILPNSLVDKYVSVIGVVSSFKGIPQINVEQPTQIQQLKNETEAKERLKQKPIKVTSPTQQLPKKVIDQDNIWDELYKNHPISPAPKPVVSPSPKSIVPPTPKPVVPPTPKPIVPPVQRSVPSSPSTPIYTNTTSKKSVTSNTESNDYSLIVPIIFAIIGAIGIGSISNGKLWYVGAIGGFFVGNWIQSWFKS